MTRSQPTKICRRIPSRSATASRPWSAKAAGTGKTREARAARQKLLHAIGEQRMAAVILIGLANRKQRGAKGALSALRNNDLAGVSKVGGNAGNQREFESARPRA